MVDIKLDDAIIAETMNEVATAAIQDAMGSFDIKDKVQKAVADAIVGDALTKAVTAAVEQVAAVHCLVAVSKVALRT